MVVGFVCVCFKGSCKDKLLSGRAVQTLSSTKSSFSGSVLPEVSAFTVLHSLSGFPCLVKNKTCSSG